MPTTAIVMPAKYVYVYVYVSPKNTEDGYIEYTLQ